MIEGLDVKFYMFHHHFVGQHEIISSFVPIELFTIEASNSFTEGAEIQPSFMILTK